MLEYDGRAFWEILMLKGVQAGLSWEIILRKREAFRAGFKKIDPRAVGQFGKADITRLLKDSDISRSRAKIEATIGGVRPYLALRAARQDFFCLHVQYGGRKADPQFRRASG